jgi:hypothetical protein
MKFRRLCVIPARLGRIEGASHQTERVGTAVTPYTPVRKVLGSNLDQGTGYSP